MNDFGYEGAPRPSPDLAQLRDERDQRILEAARAVAVTYGLRGVTRARVAELAGLSVGSVSNFGRTQIVNGTHPIGQRMMDVIRDALMARAAADGDLVLLRMGLADQHPAALAAPEQLRVAALTA